LRKLRAAIAGEKKVPAYIVWGLAKIESI